MLQSKFLKVNGFLCLGLILVACQSSPPTTQKNTTYRSSQERPLNVIRSSDGLQDIAWQIKQIHGKPARFYGQMPSLKLNSQLGVLQGYTGCNSIHGRYVLQTAQKSLSLEAKAGHYSCDQALAQEAELADALASVRRYQVSGQQLILLDQRGRSVIVAQKP